MSLDEHRHLWDGSDPGWTLHRFERTAWRVSIPFSNDGPSQSEILNIRKLIPELGSRPISRVAEQLRNSDEFEIIDELGNIAMRRLMDSAAQLGFKPVAEAIDRGGYLPVHSDGTCLIIEDDDVACLVAEKMLDAGVPVVEIHVD